MAQKAKVRMEETKRRNHFVPQFLLREFCESNRVFVFDKTKRKRYIATPQSSGFQEYLYTLYSEEFDSNLMEDIFARIESNAAPVIKHIVDSLTLPNDSRFNDLLLFVACMSARNPDVIGSYNDFVKEILRKTSLMITENKYDDFVNANPKTKFPSKEEMIAILHDPDQVEFTILNDMLMAFVAQSISILCDLLSRRNWYVGYVSLNKESELITSDFPVLLYWNKPGLSAYPPGFGLVSTTLAFVINPRVVLLAEFNQKLSKPISLKHFIIRDINRLHVKMANRFIYSKKPEFFFNSDTQDKVSSEALYES